MNTLCRDTLSNHKMQPKVGIYICAVVEVLIQVLAGLITGIITREKLKKELSKKPLIVVT